MTLLLIGLVLFLGIHSISIVAEGWRQRTMRRLGVGPWKGLYALISLAGFVLIVYGYAAARQQPIVVYTPPVWTRHLALLLMLPVFPLLFAAYLPGRIKATLKHPMLVATKLWALAHLLANGTLADVLLFGGFLAWAVADRISFKKRSQPDLRTAPPSKYNDVIAVVLGLVAYAAFTKWLHLYLIGVYPLPL
ncbi:MAG TPA: NnrU family protein [Steroidobacteraceae bacterium]|nr:NnrU family protein [Steroidobacteraceae bacterium]